MNMSNPNNEFYKDLSNDDQAKLISMWNGKSGDECNIQWDDSFKQGKWMNMMDDMIPLFADDNVSTEYDLYIAYRINPDV